MEDEIQENPIENETLVGEDLRNYRETIRSSQSTQYPQSSQSSQSSYGTGSHRRHESNKSSQVTGSRRHHQSNKSSQSSQSSLSQVNTSRHRETNKSSKSTVTRQPQELKNLQISDGRAYENKRLRELNMMRSPTQRNTPGVGNCFIEAVADQTR